jgi:polyisoprenoid-binding protein YceI
LSEHSTIPVRYEDGVELPAGGDWSIDAAHSTVGFWTRHLGWTKVRGRFTDVSGTVRIHEDARLSSAAVRICAASIDTGDSNRDAHLRSPDFLDVERFATLGFVSTAVVQQGANWAVAGDLTIRGVTKPVLLHAEFGGGAVDPRGAEHLMFTAQTTIERESFGLIWNEVLETGGLLVGRVVTIDLEVSLVRGG